MVWQTLSLLFFWMFWRAVSVAKALIDCVLLRNVCSRRCARFFCGFSSKAAVGLPSSWCKQQFTQVITLPVSTALSAISRYHYSLLSESPGLASVVRTPSAAKPFMCTSNIFVLFPRGTPRGRKSYVVIPLHSNHRWIGACPMTTDFLPCGGGLMW